MGAHRCYDAGVTTPVPSDSPADLLCPLCGYNLRGLTTPRCPECGFAFTWAELLDERRDRHPWLFEHGRRRNVRTFLATYVRSAFPRRFWRTVTPANPVHVGRLLAYWAIANVALALVAAVPTVRLVVETGRRDVLIRSMYTPTPGQPGHYDGPDPQVVQYVGYYGGPAVYRNTFPIVTVTAAQLDAVAPPVASTAFAVQARDAWQAVRSSYLWSSAGDPGFVPAVAIVLAWPWLSVAALLVFAASMRRAKVSPVHVVRAAVYGCDLALLAAVAAAVLWGTAVRPPSYPRYMLYSVASVPLAMLVPTGPVRPAALPAVFAVVLCAAVASYRLSVGYARYLRFPHAVATVLAAQGIVVLVVGVVLLRAIRLF